MDRAEVDAAGGEASLVGDRAPAEVIEVARAGWAPAHFGERGGAFAPTERNAMTSYVFTHATVLDGTEGMEPQPNMTV